MADTRQLFVAKLMNPETWDSVKGKPVIHFLAPSGFVEMQGDNEDALLETLVYLLGDYDSSSVN